MADLFLSHLSADTRQDTDLAQALPLGDEKRIQDTLEKAEELLSHQDQEAFKALVRSLHPSDIAQLIQYLSPSLRAEFIRLYEAPIEGEVLSYLDDVVREDVMALLSPQQVASAVSSLESHEAASLIEDLPEDDRQAIVSAMDPVRRALVEETLAFPEESAGRLMHRRIPLAFPHWTVSQVLQYFAYAPQDLPESFDSLYIIDPQRKPLGMIPLSVLIRTPGHTPLSHILEEDILCLPVTLDQEEVAVRFQRYNASSALVVDENNGLVGMIRADDVVHVIAQEAEEDLLHLGGVASSDFYEPILTTSLSRLQWLVVTLLNALLASAVIAHFRMVLEKRVALAILMPIVASMGGNAGMQAITVTVRALATQALSTVNFARTLGKEMAVALLNGTVLGGILGSVASLWFGDSTIGLILASAMIFNMLWAGIAGTMLPFIVGKVGMDPALSSGPLLTTTTDVLGFSLFLGLAHLLVR